MLYINYIAQDVYMSVRLSRYGILWKRLNVYRRNSFTVW